MTGIWRQVLAAYTTDQHDERDREQLLALGAAELAHARSGEGTPATAEDVQHIARQEFGLLISITQARTALRERRTRHG
ncbi:hypothetical protein RI578_19825 [Streptomyces sp. BB1-1-1]|uniref:hypothetical protein n=1 Tax=Streptomyces sp. BB1-1-1 TaxID=3074430 RepID=UPI00287726BB|nr:hypothetical protein [Streptomyces sp. BB1-1-1]WND36393.1 hypothetical protein RI578_19825 [Streptomyces sp. BB1-1-1]